MNSLLPTTPAGASAGAELFTSDGRALPLVGARLVGEAQGGLARLVLEQKFANTYAENLKVTYRMPLPADGAVSGYEFVIGERVVKGVVDKKQRARERFEQAIASGRTAALLEQERADIFTQQIGNIPPGEAVLARITIDQRLVWLPEGEWELRFPTVIGPRYIGSADTAADVRATHIKVTDKPLSASIQIAVAIKDAISGGGKASSPTHSLSTVNGVTELSAGARLDRDIVLRWPVAAQAPGISMATASGQQGTYGLLTIVPPSPKAKPTAVPRDLIVLLDTSGSMSGGPLDKAKQVVCMMLDSLNEHDRFEVIEFNMQPTRYNDEPLVATAKAKAAAIKWVRSRTADGGTEMRAGVIEAMQSLRVGAQRQIVIVTDGYVGGERQILEAINRRLPKSCRIHVLGVGSAVNRSLATALARAGRGVEVIVDIDDDAERSAKRLLDRTSMPLLTNVEITGSAVMRHAPDRIPDVFEKAPLVAALAIRAEGGQVVVRGQLGNEDWEQTIEVPATKPGEGNGAILALYGRERVADVEANALFGSVDGEIEELGLVFQIATRMTSWLAIDETRKVTGPTRDELVPQELPYGTSAGAFGLRAPAATPAQGMMTTRAGTVSARSMAVMKEVDALRSLAPMDVGEARFDMDEEFGGEGPSAIFAEDAKSAISAEFEQAEATGRTSPPAQFADDELAPPPAAAAPRAPASYRPGMPMGGAPRGPISGGR
ncbi:MAG TPA: VIT domain-containing protein, partial [Kofleriaceae bacterium]|nr:VIT domain-containing protein [Kofleriaceae bacterium]